ncbi:transcription factor bHLH18-like [Phragmites australis]|uniref:transcription factor bHLH18-like n=1 Tax=Phragmites australis TaxID=29695 RepID=UPI002D777116|nr:transcription factor bHLH18-like [Phragmites australis]
MATQWFSNMAMDEPSFFHQWQSDDLLEQYAEQQIAAAFGQGEVDQAVAAALMEHAAGAEHRPQKAAKVNTSWDSCITDQGSPADSSSPTILSFGGHADTGAMFAKAQARSASYYGASAAPVTVEAPKQEVEAVVPPFQAQARPIKRTYDAMVVAEPTKAPATTRPASQNQDHILAERKRREKLSQRFIALSKIVPGLEKLDKASVLGDAIKYVKQLQDQVKGLEDEARRRPVEAAVLVKKSHLSAAADDGSSCDESFVAGESGTRTALPEIEARVSDRTVLVKIHCENRKGAIITMLSEVERLSLTIMSTNVLPFTPSSLHVTITAMAGEDFCLCAKDIVKKLNQAFKSSL